MRGGDLAELAAFVTVAEHRSIGGTAARLRVTPSASAIGCDSSKNASVFVC
jgi:hypothetical protein